jgi:hypothetical protein
MAAFLIALSSLCGDPLFVSLGSVCEVAHALKGCGVRKESFPFDWITSIDSEKFLQIIEEDFAQFFDESCLCPARKDPWPLLHTCYRLEFLHEGMFREDLYAASMEKFQAKYQRRVERFRKLADYPGKVVFLRTAYPHSLTDPHRYYSCADNVEINDEYAWRLYRALLNLFPQLDFTLLIINSYEGNDVCEEKRLNDRLIKVKSNPGLEAAVKWRAYEKYFDSLYQE